MTAAAEPAAQGAMETHVPLYYECDSAKRRVTVVSMGSTGLDEALQVIDRQAEDGAWSYGVLYDARLGFEAPSEDDVRRLVVHVGSVTTRRGPRGPVAFIVADPQLFKMGSRYSQLGDLTALTVRVFTNIEDAEKWLDLRSGTESGPGR